MATNPESILDSIKKVLGFDSTYTAFDIDVLMHVNAVFGSLQQLGVGPRDGFSISDNTTLWSDYTSYTMILNMVKSYMYIKVRLMFDPPATSFTIKAMQDNAAEWEWRILSAVESLDIPSDPFTPDQETYPDALVLLGDVAYAQQLQSRWGYIGVSGAETTNEASEITQPPYWWNLTGHSDFPALAADGDLGIDTVTGGIWAKETDYGLGFMWDLTGLSDFPADAVIGDMGYDTVTGDVWRKTV